MLSKQLRDNATVAGRIPTCLIEVQGGSKASNNFQVPARRCLQQPAKSPLHQGLWALSPPVKAVCRGSEKTRTCRENSQRPSQTGVAGPHGNPLGLN